MKKTLLSVLASCLFLSHLTLSHAQEDNPYKTSHHDLPKIANQKSPNTNQASVIHYELPQAYDSRAFNHTTPAKNQYNFGDCWAFSANATTETNLIKKGIADNQLNLSEYQLLYHFYHRNNDPLSLTEGDSNVAKSAQYFDVGGNNELTAAYLSTWGGLILDEKALHPSNASNVYDVDASLNYESDYKIINTMTISANDHNAIKQALMKYGALSTAYFSDGGSEINHAYYYKAGQTSTNHSVTLVGYDDTISKDLFYPNTPSQDGAWIIKNSWGDYIGDEGYNYISYDSFISDCIVLDATTKETYDYNYHYDGSSTILPIHIGSNEMKVANVYTAQKGTAQEIEYLDAINIGIASDHCDYEIQVYTNLETTSKPESGTKVFATPQKGSKEHPGFYTINLKERIPLEKGQLFSISVTLKDRDASDYAMVMAAGNNDYGWIEFIETTNENQSFATYSNSTSYLDFHNYGYVARLKAFTNVESVTNLKTLTDTHITLEKNTFTYSGGAIMPDVEVIYDNNTLIQDVDYSVEYINNINSGTAYVAIRGLNEYEGYVEVPFTISDETYDETVENYEGHYDGNEHTFTLSNYPVNSTVYYQIAGSDLWSLEKPSLTKVGTLNINYRIEHPDYSTHYGKASITIHKGILSMPIEPATYQYDGYEHTLDFNLSDDFTILYRSNINEPYTSTPISIKEVGSITIYYKITHECYEDYEGSTTITILPLPTVDMDIQILNYEGVFDDTYHSFELKNVPTNASITYQIKDEQTTTKPSFINAGTYTIDFTITCEGYNDYQGSASVTINPKAFDEIISDQSHIYDGNQHAITISNIPEDTVITFSKDGFVSDDIYSSITYVQSGTYQYYYRLEHPNYITKEHSFFMTIHKATPNYELNIQNYKGIYDEKEHSFEMNVPDDATIYYRVNNNEIQTTTKPSFINAGTYDIEILVTSDNYEDYKAYAQVDINKAQFDVTLNAYEGIYDEQEHSFEMIGNYDAGTIEYFVNGQYTETKPSFKDANTYDIDIIITNPNYETYQASTQVIIHKAKFDLEVNGYTGIYDEQEHSFEMNVPDDATIYYRVNNNESQTTKPSFIDAGSYDIEILVTADNYEDLKTITQVVIEKAQFNISSKDYVGKYDGNKHSFELTCDIDDVSIEYFVDDAYTTIKPQFSEPGQYIIPYRISKNNYETYVGQAKVEIKALDKYNVTLTSNFDNANTLISANSYQEYDEVCIEAIAQEGYQFLYWMIDDEIVSTQAIYRFEITQDVTIKAIFEKEMKTVTILYDENQLEVFGMDDYEYGSMVEVQAKCFDQIQFIGWYVDDQLVSEDPIYQFVLTDDLTLEARSMPITTYELTLSSNKDAILTGSGTYEEHQQVTISTSAKAMYRFIGWYSNGELVSTSQDYTFTLTTDTNLQAKYELILPFDDVSNKDWYYKIVCDAYESGLMSGTTPTTFEPNLPTTRGMVATILYRMAHYPATTYVASFPDVKQNLWYSNAINWASSIKVVNGYNNGSFGPDDYVTREQLAIMIYNYALKVSDVDTSVHVDLDQFKDANQVNAYATKAMKWMIEHQIISGKVMNGQTYLDPHAKATRSECAKMLYLAQQIFQK